MIDICILQSQGETTADLNEYLNKRGITAKQLDVVREQTQTAIDATVSCRSVKTVLGTLVL